MTAIPWSNVALATIGSAFVLVAGDRLLSIGAVSQAWVGWAFMTLMGSAVTWTAAHAKGHAEGYEKGLSVMPPSPPGTDWRPVPSFSPPPSDAMLTGNVPLPPQSYARDVSIHEVETSPETPTSKAGKP